MNALIHIVHEKDSLCREPYVLRIEIDNARSRFGDITCARCRTVMEKVFMIECKGQENFLASTRLIVMSAIEALNAEKKYGQEHVFRGYIK